MNKPSRELRYFHRAIQNENYETIDKYINLISEYNIETEYAAIHIAVRCQHVQLITYLVQHSADINQRTYDNESSALKIAVRHSWVHIIKLLFDLGAKIDTSFTIPLLTTAVRTNDTDIVKLLLQHGADPNQKENHSINTPFTVSILHSNFNIVQLLLQHGANVNDIIEWSNNEHDIPLNFVICYSNNEPLIKLLLRHSADVHFLDERKRSPLHFAAAENNINIIQLLLNYYY